MKGYSRFDRLWAGVDNLLLVSVFVLIGVVWFSVGTADKKTSATRVGRNGRVERSKPFVSTKRPSPRRAVDALRVMDGRGRMNRIARSMVDSGWEQVPLTPALDMRENGKVYEVMFGLPDEFVRDSIRVTASGDVLTFTMRAGDSGRIYSRRVRVPCGVDREGALQTCVSNDVLHVRIFPQKLP